MQFCPIMPIRAFEKFGKRSRSHMALAQYLHLGPYFKFFEERLMAGHTVILDNGAYEGAQMRSASLATWVQTLRPSVVVLPDEPGSFSKTIHKAMDYLTHHPLPHGVEGMTVLHGTDGHLAQFETAYEVVQTAWVGFSRLTKHFGAQDLAWLGQRSAFARHLQGSHQWRKDLKHHALGMLNADVAELRWLRDLNFTSCDSSAPIWRGLHGYSLHESWPNYEYQPEIAQEACNWPQAGKNLEEVLEACGQD